MFTKVIIISLFGLFAIASVTACTKNEQKEEQKKVNHVQQDVITMTLTGSTKSPDPILVKVLALEKKGILSNVVVMESFPVQIRVTGPRNVINELASISNK